MPEKIRIFVADDHPIVREGLIAILSTQPDFEIVGEAANGSELLQLVEQLDPQIILIDLEMPQIGGVDAISQIHNHKPSVQFIVFTAFDTDECILNAVKAGAKGYLLKGAPREEIFRAIRVVSQGGSLLEPVVATRLLQQLATKGKASQTLPPDALTERETEVLHKLAQGKMNKEIAAELFITERTVKFYVSAILSKLGASNRTEAVTLAAQRGLVKL